MSFKTNKMKIALILTVVLAYAFAAPNKYIIEGSEVDIEDFPYQVSVQWEQYNTYYHICGGAVLDKKKVITARHCCDSGKGNLHVLANSNDVNINKDNIGDKELIKVMSIDYVTLDKEPPTAPTAEADLCVLHLNEELTNTAFVTIPGKRLDNVDLTLLGWGSESDGNSEISETKLLQSKNPQLMKDEDCQTLLIELGVDPKFLHDDNFCTLHDKLASGNSQTVCKGDSGGPLVQIEVDTEAKKSTYNLIGVVSWGIIPCGAEKIPSIFTDVIRYKEEIESSVSKTSMK